MGERMSHRKPLPKAQVPEVTSAEFGWKGGDRPGRLVFANPVSDYLYEQISAWLVPFSGKGGVAEIKSLEPTDDLSGRYLVRSRDEEWFVRISARIGNAELELDIIRYLGEQGVSVNPILYTKACEADQNRKYRIDIRPFVHGDHRYTDIRDNESLVEMILKMHRALADIPCRRVIKDQARARYSHLNRIKHRLAQNLAGNIKTLFHENSAWAEENSDWLDQMVHQFNPMFHQAENAQPLHGELHRGNVLFTENGVVFLDFEESVHTYAPPGWDWAYFLQRFCLYDNPDISVFKNRIPRNFFQIIDPKDAGVFIREAAWFSMAVILDLRHRCHIRTPLSEYDKFIALESQADFLEQL